MSNAIVSNEGMTPFQIRITDDWRQSIDDWRRKQPKIPTVAEAIRRLVEIGLQAENIATPMTPSFADAHPIVVNINIQSDKP